MSGRISPLRDAVGPVGWSCGVGGLLFDIVGFEKGCVGGGLRWVMSQVRSQNASGSVAFGVLALEAIERVCERISCQAFGLAFGGLEGELT